MIRNLDQLCDYLANSIDRAESKDWCVLTLLADDDTCELLSDLMAARDFRDPQPDHRYKDDRN